MGIPQHLDVLMDLGPDLALGLGPGPGLGVLSSLLLTWRVNQGVQLVLKSRWDKTVTAQLNTGKLKDLFSISLSIFLIPTLY